MKSAAIFQVFRFSAAVFFKFQWVGWSSFPVVLVITEIRYLGRICYSQSDMLLRVGHFPGWIRYSGWDTLLRVGYVTPGRIRYSRSDTLLRVGYVTSGRIRYSGQDTLLRVGYVTSGWIRYSGSDTLLRVGLYVSNLNLKIPQYFSIFVKDVFIFDLFST